MTDASASIELASPAVLVVEDESMIRMGLTCLLEDSGYRVVEAENADVALLKLAEQRDIQAVITDLRMPGSIDGLGLAAWMREHRPKVPIVITSGFGTLPDLAAINPAIARVVTKPYRAQEASSWLRDLGCIPAPGD